MRFRLENHGLIVKSNTGKHFAFRAGLALVLAIAGYVAFRDKPFAAVAWYEAAIGAFGAILLIHLAFKSGNIECDERGLTWKPLLLRRIHLEAGEISKVESAGDHLLIVAGDRKIVLTKEFFTSEDILALGLFIKKTFGSELELPGLTSENAAKWMEVFTASPEQTADALQRHHTTKLASHLIFLFFIILLPLIGLFGGGFLFSYSIDHFSPLGDSIYYRFLIVGVVLFIVFSWLISHYLGNLRAGLFVGLLNVMTLVFSPMAIAMWVNGQFDGSQPVARVVSILDKRATRSEDPSYYLKIRFPGDPTRSVDLDVPLAQYRMADAAHSMLSITTKAGFLGYAWIIEHGPPSK